MPAKKKKSLQDKVFGAIAKPVRKAGAAAGRATAGMTETNRTMRKVGKAVKKIRKKAAGGRKPYSRRRSK